MFHPPTALIAVVIMTTMTVSASEATFRVIDAKDADALSEAGDSVYLTCETCHARYMGK